MVPQIDERTNLLLEYQQSVQRLKGVQAYVEKHKKDLDKRVCS